MLWIREHLNQDKMPLLMEDAPAVRKWKERGIQILMFIENSKHFLMVMENAGGGDLLRLINKKCQVNHKGPMLKVRR